MGNAVQTVCNDCTFMSFIKLEFMSFRKKILFSVCFKNKSFQIFVLELGMEF